MKKIVFILITIFCMCCMVACGGEVKEDVSASSSNEVPDNSANDQPVVTEAPIDDVEATPAPTAEAEVTPEPTENPYPGIDMQSDLPAIEWIETFVGVIDEPKVVIYSDITGRKQIVEEGDKVFINPEEDIIAVYLPEGYKYASKTAGIYKTSLIDGDHSLSCVLDVEKTVEKKFHKAGMFVEHEGEEIEIGFTIQTQE